MAELKYIQARMGKFVDTKDTANTSQIPIHRKTTRKAQEQRNQSTTTFEIMRLPTKVRLRIWEATWPKSRIVGHRMASNRDNEEQELIHYLQVVGSLEAYSNADYYKILNHAVIEPCPDPVALQICRESRTHTLSTYIPMMNNRFPFGSFYFDPRRDMLLLCWDFDLCKPSLDLYYGEQMSRFQNVMIDGHFWAKDYGECYEDALEAIQPDTPDGLYWLFEALYEAWGVGLDPCGVRAAVRFVSTILDRTEAFQRLHGRLFLVNDIGEMEIVEDLGKIMLEDGEEGTEEECLGVTGSDVALYTYLGFVEISRDHSRIDAIQFCTCSRHPRRE
ncbi:hypothetical protein ASPCADRAFT_131118 [Aspergillus carbonarius ITEM 5010]|uniref:2EXR domain-containing protein n=1 Tax=Aspergillus carbonarius (strain ITEM 5010) TaxID=602072 RepID=A0A1R3RJ28_ASPC5|nr:hypothetical protein ASPCADRAFT_131118 [Aspergillus carbonarius ITEM 5010]